MALRTALTCLLLAAAAPAAAQLGEPERAVLTALNICWEAEEGADLGQVARSYGFYRVPQARAPMQMTEAGASVVFLSADFGAGADGDPEPACRITVLKPNLDTAWTPPGPPLPAGSALVERIISASAGFGRGYQVLQRAASHPRRPGRTGTLLRSDEGRRARLIYIEQGPADYEFLYVAAAREVADAPATRDIGTDPSLRTVLQAFVNDRWEIAFCELNPHACRTPEQLRAEREAASQDRGWSLPSLVLPGSRDDPRAHQRQLQDSAWWDNYHRCGRGTC